MNLNKYFATQQAQLRVLISNRDKFVAEKIANQYCIPTEEILEFFQSFDNPSCQPIQLEIAIPPKGCSYVFKRGEKKNQQCNAKIKCNSEFCSKHHKEETKLTLSKPKLISSKPKLILRKHDYFKEYYIHEATGFLVKTKKDGIIGKIQDREDNVPIIVELDDEDFEKCKKLRLPVYKSKLTYIP